MEDMRREAGMMSDMDAPHAETLKTVLAEHAAPETPSVLPAPGGSIGYAVYMMKAGGKVSRMGWNGKGMHLYMVRPSISSDASLNYIMMSTVTGDTVPWLCSQSDLLATDWGYVA